MITLSKTVHKTSAEFTRACCGLFHRNGRTCW
jgi:hypothetical protein